MKRSLSRSICISSSCFNIALSKLTKPFLLCADYHTSTGLNGSFTPGTIPSQGQEGRSHPENQHLPSCEPLVQPGGVAGTPGSLTQLQAQAALRTLCTGCVSPWNAAPCTGFQGVPYLHAVCITELQPKLLPATALSLVSSGP